MSSWWSRRTSERLREIPIDAMFAALPRPGATHAHPWRLDIDQSERLQAAARSHQTSLHGILVAALLLGVAARAEGDGSRYRVSHPFDLRSELRPPVGDDLGLFIAPIWTEHEVEPTTELWDLARQVTLAILEAIARGDHFGGAVEARQSAAPNFVLDRDQMARTLTVSNLGRLPFPERIGDLEVVEIFASGSITVALPVLSACLVGGRLSGMLQHPQTWRQRQDGAEIAAELEQRLRRLAER